MEYYRGINKNEGVLHVLIENGPPNIVLSRNVINSVNSLHKKGGERGDWVAQSFKHPSFGFGSGHDLTVLEIEPHVGLCAGIVGSAWDSLCLSLLFFFF